MDNDLKSSEALKAYAREVLCGNNPTNSILIRMFDEIIDNAPSQWIPIKTRELTEEEKEEYPDCTFMYDCRLPDDGEEVLVTTWTGDVALDTFCRDDGCYFENYCDEGDVIAWMPKPESYKKEGEEE